MIGDEMGPRLDASALQMQGSLFHQRSAAVDEAKALVAAAKQNPDLMIEAAVGIPEARRALMELATHWHVLVGYFERQYGLRRRLVLTLDDGDQEAVVTALRYFVVFEQIQGGDLARELGIRPRDVQLAKVLAATIERRSYNL